MARAGRVALLSPPAEEQASAHGEHRSRCPVRQSCSPCCPVRQWCSTVLLRRAALLVSACGRAALASSGVGELRPHVPPVLPRPVPLLWVTTKTRCLDRLGQLSEFVPLLCACAALCRYLELRRIVVSNSTSSCSQRSAGRVRADELDVTCMNSRPAYSP